MLPGRLVWQPCSWKLQNTWDWLCEAVCAVIQYIPLSLIFLVNSPIDFILAHLFPKRRRDPSVPCPVGIRLIDTSPCVQVLGSTQQVPESPS